MPMFIKVDRCWFDITTDFAIHHYRDEAVMKCAGARAALVVGHAGTRGNALLEYLFSFLSKNVAAVKIFANSCNVSYV